MLNSYKSHLISPQEIEMTITELDCIQEAGCTLQKNSDDKDCVVSYVVLSNSSRNKKDILFIIKAHCLQALADYKQPEKIYIIKELPHNNRGKLDRKKLKALARK